MAYIDRLAALPERPQRYIYTLYDLSFPVDLSRDVMAGLRRRHVNHSEVRSRAGITHSGKSHGYITTGIRSCRSCERNPERGNYQP